MQRGVSKMPVDLMIEYLRTHSKSMSGKWYEVYIVVVLPNCQQVLTYKEEPYIMDYDYMVQYFKNYRNQTKRNNPALYGRSLGVFFPVVDSDFLPKECKRLK